MVVVVCKRIYFVYLRVSINKMTEGSIFIVLMFPNPWPPNEEQLILKEKINDSIIQIFGLSKGQLLIKINSEIFESQNLEFSNSKRAQLSILWNNKKNPKIKVYINSKELYDKNQKDIFIITSKPEIIDNKSSFEIADSIKACAEWTTWRKDKFGIQKTQPQRDQRTIKDIEVQFQELKNSLISISSHIDVFKNDENILIMNILPILRSLLFWSDNKSRNYNPLLFRLAGFLNLPLPIFAFKDRINETKNHKLYKDAVKHRVNNFPSIIKRYPNEELMDFQEWLNMDIIIDRTIGSKEIFRWKDILIESANTGASHFDDEIPLIIDSLNKSMVWNKSSFFDYILTISQTTLELGNFIVNQKNQLSNQ